MLDLPPRPRPASINAIFLTLFWRYFEAKTHADIPPPIINRSYEDSVFISHKFIGLFSEFLKKLKTESSFSDDAKSVSIKGVILLFL